MIKIGPRGQRWLKVAHIFSVCVWVGSATVLTVMQLLLRYEDGRELYGVLRTLDRIDMWILVPGAMGAFLTALVYSIFTTWGWFKHRWITVKWAICALGIVFGTFWLGPWTTGMADLVEQLGLAATSDARYLELRRNMMIFGTAQALTVVFAVIISTVKPWKRKKAA